MAAYLVAGLLILTGVAAFGLVWFDLAWSAAWDTEPDHAVAAGAGAFGLAAWAAAAYSIRSVRRR